MPAIRVDFYLLSGQEDSARWLLACRLLEKAYLRGHRVFVYCESQKDAHQLDELLWTFKDNSFIPHNLQGEGPEPPPPIQIGYQAEPRGYSDILLNLNSNIPEFYKRFKRVMEIVVNDETAKELSRRNYKEYRAYQCELYTHNID
ncbi:DNA polymerase III subunit chi [Legionella hackeliae]|uniref:DNA polymerase III subunit chi n=1 Tax=Legionella hackeliae TaxID=449 RepID=A0A0A8US46_LEGHA|nr:DNA polymerase III subunit chi [Legionella hackeliae]KTD10423.1 DNA polymerase III subunit chi [Legionella hackeliae]CEK09922.1 DNA polymerase III subunit chi [Legionella hackeliae]STX49838.1 DNA polymerase III subunit chi [Legionella hackeliae]